MEHVSPAPPRCRASVRADQGRLDCAAVKHAQKLKGSEWRILVVLDVGLVSEVTRTLEIKHWWQGYNHKNTPSPWNAWTSSQPAYSERAADFQMCGLWRSFKKKRQPGAVDCPVSPGREMFLPESETHTQSSLGRISPVPHPPATGEVGRSCQVSKTPSLKY